ncbi:hypothetical protein RHMOL_Rhmol01G0338800 [Rhododendron molle]|uniref:Uncharacterized protein n=1 Tax=Rhododendron molle TaxID=49168 RepID=A0ACC0Q9Y7_RHOML|nr:hypothetical protein RHMOL_Rhmol01G0338800 [Rhododendron molle]
MLVNVFCQTKPSVKTSLLTSYNTGGRHSVSLLHIGPKPGSVYQSVGVQALSRRCISTMDNQLTLLRRKLLLLYLVFLRASNSKGLIKQPST